MSFWFSLVDRLKFSPNRLSISDESFWFDSVRVRVIKWLDVHATHVGDGLATVTERSQRPLVPNAVHAALPRRPPPPLRDALPAPCFGLREPETRIFFRWSSKPSFV